MGHRPVATGNWGTLVADCMWLFHCCAPLPVGSCPPLCLSPSNVGHPHRPVLPISSLQHLICIGNCVRVRRTMSCPRCCCPLISRSCGFLQIFTLVRLCLSACSPSLPLWPQPPPPEYRGRPSHVFHDDLCILDCKRDGMRMTTAVSPCLCVCMWLWVCVSLVSGFCFRFLSPNRNGAAHCILLEQMPHCVDGVDTVRQRLLNHVLATRESHDDAAVRRASNSMSLLNAAGVSFFGMFARAEDV